MQIATNALQTEADELLRLLPYLAPSFLPAGVRRDLLELAAKEGDAGCQALLEVVSAAGDSVEECSLCGEEGEVVVDPDGDARHGVALRLLLRFALDFDQKCLKPTKCQFACVLCRQLQNTAGLLQEIAASRIEEESTAEALIEHLAEVNELHEIADDPSACNAWAQEVLCRTYALQIASSAITGWRLVNPDGSEFQVGRSGAAAGLALQLLLPEATAKERSTALSIALVLPNVAEELDDSTIHTSNMLQPKTVQQSRKARGVVQNSDKKKAKKGNHAGIGVLAPEVQSSMSKVKARKSSRKRRRTNAE